VGDANYKLVHIFKNKITTASRKSLFDCGTVTLSFMVATQVAFD